MPPPIRRLKEPEDAAHWNNENSHDTRKCHSGMRLEIAIVHKFHQIHDPAVKQKNGKANNHQGEFLEVPFHTIASVTVEGRSGVAGRAGIVSISIPSRETGGRSGRGVICKAVVAVEVVVPGIKRL